MGIADKQTALSDEVDSIYSRVNDISQHVDGIGSTESIERLIEDKYELPISLEKDSSISESMKVNSVLGAALAVARNYADRNPVMDDREETLQEYLEAEEAENTSYFQQKYLIALNTVYGNVPEVGADPEPVNCRITIAKDFQGRHDETIEFLNEVLEELEG